jgi:hypothetical protein
MFKDGRTNVHDEELSGRSSAVCDDLVQSERQLFTISQFSCEFSQISCTLLYDNITVRLGYHKFCARWVPKMLTGAHKTQRLHSAFLQWYHKDGDEPLNHIIQAASDETWV